MKHFPTLFNLILKRCFSSHTKGSEYKGLKIGIALGSGSARGLAHIGVLRALEEHGIHPTIVTGTSIGSLVAGSYASNKLDILEKWVRQVSYTSYLKLMDPAFLKMNLSGLIGGDKILQTMIDHAGGDWKIEDLPRKFGAIATNLRTGEEVQLTTGSLLRAIRASIAIPVAFAPAKFPEKGMDEWLVDGALVNPVPVNLCKQLGADFVIAVNLQKNVFVKSFDKHIEPNSLEGMISNSVFGQVPQKIKEDASSLWEVALRTPLKLLEAGAAPLSKLIPKLSFPKSEDNNVAAAPHLIKVFSSSVLIIQHQLTKYKLLLDPPDVEITPHAPEMDASDFHKGQYAIHQGRKSVEKVIHVIKDSLKKATDRHLQSHDSHGLKVHK